MRFEQEWLDSLRSKKGLSSLDSLFVQRQLEASLVKNSPAKLKLSQAQSWSEFKRSRECESVSKEVRSLLREVYAVFWQGNKREPLLKSLINSPSVQNHEEILALHSSTRERLPYYKEVYKSIFAVTKKPKRILDLACGFNPFSYSYLGCHPEYLANELCQADADFIQSYFNALKINGKAFAFDLLEFNKTPFLNFLHSDVCFLFKALDSLEALHWNFSERLLQNIPANYLVVSFSTKSLGGKKEIKSSKRAWFERLLSKHGWRYTTFSIPNELFYIIQR